MRTCIARWARVVSLGSCVFWAASLHAAADPAPSDRYENIELFHKVLNFVESNYVDNVTNKQLIHGAIKGMLETLDPHSNFLPPKVFKDMKEDTSGKFGGIGIEIGVKDNVLTVISPMEDTPAWKAGIQAGDRILKINGESTKGLSLVEAVGKMRGKKGSPIKLTVFREGFSHPKEISVMRDIIKVQSVRSEVLEPGFGYMKLASFNENAAADLKKAMDKMEKDGKLKGLIFDLRMNPGGLLDQAVDVSSLFIDSGVVVSTIGRNKDQKEIKYAKKGMARKDLPLVVLVNSSSASAAEIVAGALQDNHRAVVMGQPTFGKGSVQTVVELGQEMGLKLTIARYYTPSGRSIQEKGVQPDILLEDYDPKLLAEAKRKSDGLREKDLRGHMTNPDAVDEDNDITLEDEIDAAANKTAVKEKDKKGEEPPRFNPKDDYQVLEALSHLKGFEIYQRMGKSQGA